MEAPLKENESGRFLAFELDGNQYAIEVERVEVVLETVPITRVPKASPYLKGVINYRGAVVPVADLRSRFVVDGAIRSLDLPESVETVSEEHNEGTHSGAENIIVLHINYADNDIVIGILADSVREVVDIDPSHIERAPELGGPREKSLIAGIGNKDGNFIVILDIDEAFNEDNVFMGSSNNAEEGHRDAIRLTREDR